MSRTGWPLGGSSLSVGVVVVGARSWASGGWGVTQARSKSRHSSSTPRPPPSFPKTKQKAPSHGPTKLPFPSLFSRRICSPTSFSCLAHAYLDPRRRICATPSTAIEFHHHAQPGDTHAASGPVPRENASGCLSCRAKQFASASSRVLTSPANHYTPHRHLRDTTMSGENGRATPPAEGAQPAVAAAGDATTKKVVVDAHKPAAPAAETKPAAESGAEPAPAPAAAEPSAESNKAAKGTLGPCRRVHKTSPLQFLCFISLSLYLANILFSLVQQPPTSPPSKPRRSPTPR